MGKTTERATAKDRAEQVIPTACGICPSRCGAIAYVRDGRLARVSADPKHPYGHLCPLGNASVQIVYSPNRIRHPLKRVGQKGEGKFQRITWDEALESVASKLRELKRKYGAECLAKYAGRGSFAQESRAGGRGAWLAALGSPNDLIAGSLCAMSHLHLSPSLVYGRGMPLADFEHGDCYILWGVHYSCSAGLQRRREDTTVKPIFDAKQKGMKLIVIDPRLTDIGTQADMWVPVRPGTDGALALGMLNVIIEEDLYDADFIDRWTIGFEELKEYVKEFTPEKVQEITWVPADRIREVARIYGTKRTSFHTFTGLEYATGSTAALRAIWMIIAITGNLDVPGGNVWSMPGEMPRTSDFPAPFPPEGVKPFLGKEEFPLFGHPHVLPLAKAVLEGEPYPIKFWWIDGASPLTQFPETKIWERVLKELEFIVVEDRVLTKEAYYADIVLPATTYYENYSFITFPGYIQLLPKVIEPLGEAWNDIKIHLELSKKLGFGELYPFNTEEEFVRWAIQPSGLTIEELEKRPGGIAIPMPEVVYKKYEKGLLRHDGKPGFPTPSGKVEISSSVLKERGYNPLPVYVEPVESPYSQPDLVKEYPLIFNSGHRLFTGFASQFHDIPWCIELDPKPWVEINTRDAEERGIEDGDDVFVKSPRGSYGPVRARVTERIIPGVIEAAGNTGQPYGVPAWSKSGSLNLLTDIRNVDPITGFPCYKSLLCEVKRAPGHSDNG
jgi:anaerobic selenocysteine-containing dehydrogenase